MYMNIIKGSKLPSCFSVSAQFSESTISRHERHEVNFYYISMFSAEFSPDKTKFIFYEWREGILFYLAISKRIYEFNNVTKWVNL